MTEVELAWKIVNGIINATSGLVTYLTQMQAIKADYEAAKANGTIDQHLASLTNRSAAADADLRAYLATRGILPQG